MINSMNEKILFDILADTFPDQTAYDAYTGGLFKLLKRVKNISPSMIQKIEEDAYKTDNKKGIKFIQGYRKRNK